MSLNIQLDPDFEFVGADAEAMSLPKPRRLRRPRLRSDRSTSYRPEQSPGVWVGHGFNAIWRPHRPFDRAGSLPRPGPHGREARVHQDRWGHPEPGLATPNINMFGVTYLQQINRANQPAEGLRIEPGIWAHVPQTSDPADPSTVVRMASIPHGTVINAQGVFQVIQGGPQNIPDKNILPFFFGQPPHTNAEFDSVAQQFPELDLSIPTQFRSLSPGVTQQIVKNPTAFSRSAHALAPGDEHEEPDVPEHLDGQPHHQGWRGQQTPLFLPRATIPQAVTPGRRTSRRRFGSRRSP